MTTKRLRWIKWPVLLAIIPFGFYAYSKFIKKSAEAAITYRTASAVRGDIVQSVTANGQLNPVVTVAVGSQVSGNIQKLYADFNSRVTNKQLIAELDPATYQSRVIQAQGELASARAQFQLARVNARRAEELLKSSLVAQSDYDQTMADLAQREAAVLMREAALTNALVDFERTKIYSPIDGTVISRNVDVGQTVQASFTAPTLFNIANDLAKMEIGAMVSEADIGGVEEGQEATFTVEAFPNRTFQGRVKQVRNQPATNQNVVNYAAMIDVANPDLKLKPGMTANVSITTSRKEKVLKLPNAALRFRLPEGAVLKSNAVASAVSGTNPPPAAVAASAGGDGIPEMPGGFQLSPEARQRILQRYDKNGDGKLDDAEREAMLEGRRRRMAEGGGGEGGGGMGMGGGGGLRSRSAVTSPVRTVYLVSTNSVAGRSVIELQPVQVHVGISDGASTEITEGLKEGDSVAVGSTGGTTPTTAPTGSPFGGPFGGPRRM